ncbi:early nodulin-like protein 5 [Raphanus sativus]|uniref:Early nodulin-like protein 21 n=1 Tax=Raphanus sativus TaxID=3726 RepID=A0A6J0JRL6_RAPSA|nr:early nodulin-like protein 21 [Raphanus sativus]XP_056856062.1 early nodulin-like protein 21 [Raphanus sativus]XP_056856506.1 early nodulin-like protein 21 [Raphanus sativus]XP_056867290.1 early nodulin-like protein 21 [Raphanus sativus]KAJ4867504.1 early nodulin-like protein 5 [Raphanus sativus]KAJ4868073.1 early nodulin-like protein 5 [Raphanus sativus]KAJ4886872.1 early nodulin-like protein 5 [Raphanus sativus]KAJ4895029.1 early nodulin-like protein 5 [Raphanus sativus]
MSPSEKITLVTVLVSFYMFSCVSSTELEVGGEDGWVVPNSNKSHGDMFNQWASHNRFKVGDTIRFKYKKDSVLVVSEDEYKQCKATKPQLYSNNQDTVFKLDRPGLFYFISGVSGHCEKGQKMIIKVMETESSPDSPPPSSPSSLPGSTHKKSSALKTAVKFTSSCFVVLIVSVLVWH